MDLRRGVLGLRFSGSPASGLRTLNPKPKTLKELQGFRVAGFRVLGFGFRASVLDVRVQGLPGFKVFLLGAFVTLFGETTKSR